MYQTDTAEELAVRIETALNKIQAQLERDKTNLADLSWSDVKELAHTAVMLEITEALRTKT